ncbi:O-methyltransferase [Pseudarthrobacter sp902506025]|uniref:O-methyltransferase YrrM n=1 Tax=Pseudarthrobacter defluvii TaxID=410837 RepID=A0ABT9UBH5_9MICC|nr:MULTISPECIES: O-methyltransferase [Micrococcaceae]MDQ0116991.1 putative O-methyltransferase YrrM [Pseudarthrobacter defluvii]BCW81226.1 O-methyltransferase [Arthrobacter sp. NicSoilC5]
MFEHRPRPEWIATEEFLSAAVVHPDSAVQQAIHAAAEAGMPAIEVAPNAGKLLKLLVQLSGARRILEIGTLAGYSTIWMGRGLPPNGTLVTCEYLPQHAEVAWANIDAAGLGERVEIRLGPALETLAALEEEEREPFDFIFIDADKQNNSRYLDWAVRLGRPGAAVVLDNTIWEGAVLDPDIDPVNAPGIIDALKLLGNHPRLDATVIQTVGSKGWDGFALARILPQNSK